MFLNIMAVLIAITISIAAGVISVIGLASIFSGAYLAVLIVTSILEVAKVITATWLHVNWSLLSRKIKLYLSAAVVVLMMITSLGIYGFFAKAHIEQQISITTGETSRIPLIKSAIQTEQEKLFDIDKQIAQINAALSAMTEKGKASDARKALAENQKQKKTLDQLRSDKTPINEKIATLQTELVRLENSKKSQEVKTGPLKYLANLYYENPSDDQLEAAVRLLILTLVFVFDPLAIVLLIASTKKLPAAPAPPDNKLTDKLQKFFESKRFKPYQSARKRFEKNKNKNNIPGKNNKLVLDFRRLKLGKK